MSWPDVSEGHYVLHPDPITGGNVGVAMQSGALFARKFDSEVRWTILFRANGRREVNQAI